MSINRKLSILSQHPIFSGLNASDLRELAAESTFKEYSRGQVIVEEGKTVTAVRVVVHGHLEGVYENEDGETELVSQFQRTDSFGDTALFTDAPSWCTVQAVTDSLILEIDRSEITNIIQTNPTVNRDISSKLGNLIKGERNRTTTSGGTVISLLSAEHNVGKSLLAMNLSAVLQEETGAGVCLVDLTSSPSPTITEQDITSPDSSDNWFVENSEERLSGFNVISIDSEQSLSEGAIRALLATLLEHVQFVVIALPEGIRSTAEYFMSLSNSIYVLTRADEKSIYETSLLLDRIHSSENELSSDPNIILTRVDYQNSLDTSDLSDQLGAEIRHQLPNVESHLSGMGKDEKCLVIRDPDHSYSKAVRHIAHEAGEISLGLALGSGAARGLAHIGVLEVLESENIVPDMIAGASMGGLIAAGYALGHSPDRMRRHAQKFHEEGGFFKITDLSFPPTLSILRSTRIRNFLDDIFGDATFKDTNLPLKIIVADIETSEVKVVDSGRIVDAVLSSISIPMIFEPNKSGDSTYLDGGILEPIPVDRLKDRGMDHVIAVNPIPPQEVLREQQPERMKRQTEQFEFPSFLKYLFPFGKNNLIDIGMRTIEAIESRLAGFTTSEADVIIDPYLAELNWFDFDEYELFIEQGRRSAREKMDEINALVRPELIPTSEGNN